MKNNLFIVILFLLLTPKVFSQEKIVRGSYGGFQSGIDGKIEDNESNIDEIARGLERELESMKFESGYVPKESIEIFQERLRSYSLNKTANLSVRDKVLDRLLIRSAQKSFENDKFISTNNLEMVTKTLEGLSIALPKGYSDAVELKKIRNQSDDPKEYFKNIKSRFGVTSEVYKNALNDSAWKFEHTPETRELLYIAMAETGTDQKFLEHMLVSALNNEHSNNRRMGLAELIAKYYDFSTPYLGEDSMLCAQIRELDKSISLSSLEGNGITEEQKIMAEEAKKASYRLIELGASQNITCGDGRKFSHIVDEFKRIGIFNKDDFNMGVSLAANPCPKEEVVQMNLSGLCDSSKVVMELAKILKKNEDDEIKLAKGITNIDVRTIEHLTTYDDEQCTILVFDNHVSELNTTLSRKIRLQIEPKKSKNIYKLSSEDKESFLKELKIFFKEK